MNFFGKLFSSDFMPHGHCYFWLPEILWLHVISDIIIAISYYSIPITLVLLVFKRKDLEFDKIFIMFAVFIFACGTTHLMDVWTVWNPTYYLQGVLKALTALASVTTAIVCWKLLPQALRIPSISQLHNEFEERMKMQDLLERNNEVLEKKVQERTKDLSTSHLSLKEKTDKLERFYNVTVNRELEMVKLKEEVNSLLMELQRDKKYSAKEVKTDQL